MEVIILEQLVYEQVETVINHYGSGRKQKVRYGQEVLDKIIP